jgi:hypothetical protein
MLPTTGARGSIVAQSGPPKQKEALTVFFIFLAPFSKDFLKYTPDGKISENGPKAWRHPRWRQGNTAWRR